MTDNPFAPPAHPVSPHHPEAHSTGDATGFYVVGHTKFFLLAVASLGLYLPYWGYRHWKGLKAVQHVDAWPIPRGIFLPFTLHSLVNYLKAAARKRAIDVPGNLSTMATVAVILMIASNVLGRFQHPLVTALDFLCLPVSAIFLWQIQTQMNQVAGDPKGATNATLGAGAIAVILLGSIMWILALVGTFMLSTTAR